MNAVLVPDLPTDSDNYDVLVEAVQRIQSVEGLTCEIGLRRGGGTKYILDALKATAQSKVHIAIDPYGYIEYAEGDTGASLRLDYTNTMRDECLVNLYLYCLQQQTPFVFFNLEDTEFFTRFADGVPVYQGTKHLMNSYALVHFDGPHTVSHVRTEVDFFHSRCPQGAIWIFDDVKIYNHQDVHTYIRELGWSLYRTTERKWAYYKE
jgi:hypothetical protein